MRSSCAERPQEHTDDVADQVRARVPAAPTTARAPASVLALQRAAGNAATVAALSPGPGRPLARCAGACTCGGSCASHDLAEEDQQARLMRAAAEATGTTLLARAIRERQAGQDERLLQRMAACPTRLSPKDPVPKGWKPYFGDPRIFHCGYRGILENRKPSPSDPMNECFYDETGRLVDKNHPHAECGGSPDEYDASGGFMDMLRHTFLDKGGIWEAGWPAFKESAKFFFNRKWQDAKEWTGEKWRAGKRWVGDKWEDVKDWTGERWEDVKSGAGKGWRATKGAASAVGRGAKRVWNWIF